MDRPLPLWISRSLLSLIMYVFFYGSDVHIRLCSWWLPLFRTGHWRAVGVPERFGSCVHCTITTLEIKMLQNISSVCQSAMVGMVLQHLLGVGIDPAQPLLEVGISSDGRSTPC